MLKKMLIGIILFGVLAVLLLQIDDDLNPEVAILLEQAKPAEYSEAYLYLLGIVASEDEDPLTVGKQLFSSMQKAEESYIFGDEPLGYEAYPEDKKLTLPASELFCHSEKEGCWQAIFDDKQGREQALKMHTLLLHRYYVFVQMTDYQTLLKASIMDVFSQNQYLIKANRLVILNAVNEELGAEVLIENIAALRGGLQNADSLIMKLYFTIMISDNLDALSLMVHVDGNSLEKDLLPLSLSERGFSTVLSREFALYYEIFKSLENNPEIFAREGKSVPENLPVWMIKTIYKLNMTLNESSLFFKELTVRSELEQIDFASTTFEKDRPLQLRLAYLRNPVGSILNDVARPNFDRYVARLFDLNAKIAIFNQTAKKTDLPIDLDYIQNPYYETGGTAYYSEDGKSICLTGPLEDDKNQRCLRVKL